MAIHSSILAWKIPWTEEPDRLQSMGSQRVGYVLSPPLNLCSCWKHWLLMAHSCNLLLLLLLFKRLSRVQPFVIPRTAARQASLSMEFSRQEYWSGLPCASPGDLPNPGIKPRSPELQADSLLLRHQGSPFS